MNLEYFKKIIKPSLFLNIKFLKTYSRRIFGCSASLLRHRKCVLNVVFNFIYKKSKKSDFADHIQKWIN